MVDDRDDDEIDYFEESLEEQEQLVRERSDHARSAVGREWISRGVLAIAMGVAITGLSYLSSVVWAGEASYVVAIGFFLYGLYQLVRGFAAKREL